MAVFAIDTGFDEVSRWFADGRRPLYDELAAQGVTIRHSSGPRHREVLINALRNEEFETVVISAHGAVEGVFDEDGSWLIRHDDSAIALLARTERLYFCCCETGSGSLFSRLRQSGAAQVVGFRGKPEWRFDTTRRLWRELDCALVRAVITRKRSVESVRNEYLARLAELIPLFDEDTRPDLVKMQRTVTTMDVDNSVVAEGDRGR